MKMTNFVSVQQEPRVKTKITISKPAGLIALIAALFIPSVHAAPTELFISEYIEGSSFNKAIETPVREHRGAESGKIFTPLNLIYMYIYSYITTIQ